jgi:predicted O-methyltransferase YrrM
MPESLLLSIIALLAVALILAIRAMLRYRRRFHERTMVVRGGRIPTVEPEALSPAFRRSELGYGPDAEVSMIPRFGAPVLGATSDEEQWILSVLARNASVLFEFGTCTGRTAYAWARNAPADARVYTLTLPPEMTSTLRVGADDATEAIRNAQAESMITTYLYTGTDVEHKITQLYADSMTFDETSLVGRCDVIFIDGAHADSFIRSDTAKALRMLKPGGVILWHDYRGAHGDCRDVFTVLNEMADTMSLKHIHGTSLVFFRHDGSSI